MNANDANEERLIANEIMRRLYEAGEAEQLRILMLYAKRCIELIDEEKKKPRAIRKRR